MDDKWRYLVITLQGRNYIYMYRGPIQVDFDPYYQGYIVEGTLLEVFSTDYDPWRESVFADSMKFKDSLL